MKIIELVKNSVEQMETLMHEAMWATVNDKKIDLNKISGQFEEIEKKCQSNDKNVENNDKDIKELEQKKHQLVERLQNLSAEVESCKLEFEKANSDARDAERILSSKAREVDQAKDFARRTNKNIAHLESKIEGIEHKNR